MADQDENQVALWVDGRVHEGWTSVAVNMNLDHLSGGFNLTLADAYLKDGQLTRFPVAEGAAYPGYGVQIARALFGLATAGFAVHLAPELADSAGIVFKGTRPVIGVAGDDVGFLFGMFGGVSPVALIMPLWAWLAIAVHLGLVMGWFKAADIGRDRDRSRLVEGAIMTGRGLLMTAPAGALLWLLGHGPWFMASGAALGLLYELGHRTPSTRPRFNRGMEIAEVYTGIWLWLTLGLVLC